MTRLAKLVTVVGGVAFASIASADTVVLGGFQVKVPDGFSRGPDEIRLEADSQDEMHGVLRFSSRRGADEEVRAMRRTSAEGRVEILFLRSVEASEPPPDAPGYIEALAKGVVAAADPGASLISSGLRAIGSGGRAAEVRVLIPDSKAPLRLYELAVPRDRRFGSVQYLASGLTPKEADAVWESLVGSVWTTLGPPGARPEPAETSAAFRAGGWLGTAFLVAVVVWFVLRARRRPVRSNRRAIPSRENREVAPPPFLHRARRRP